MNGIEKITSRIASEAEAQVAAIKAESDKLCAEIKAGYDRQAKEESESIIAAGRIQSEQRVKRMAGTAELESRKSALAVKQELVDSAFALAEKKLLSLPENEYIDLLSRLAASAARTGTEELIFNETDKAKVGDKVASAANAALKEKGIDGKLVVSEKTRAISGGIVLSNGNVETNCAISTLVDMVRGDLASKVANILFN